MESGKSRQTQHVLREAEEGINELSDKEGWQNTFVHYFLLKEEVEYVKSRNLPRYI